MEEQIQQNPSSEKSGRKYWKFVLGFLIIIVVVAGGFFVWDKYFSQQAKLNRQNAENYLKYFDWQRNYEKAMREDTYGGKTPEETLQMFIEALKREDIELASKYFMLDERGSRQKWIDLLSRVEQENNLQRMVNDIEKYDEAKKTFDPYYLFLYYNEDGSVGLQITMHFNSYSQVWKIESL